MLAAAIHAQTGQRILADDVVGQHTLNSQLHSQLGLGLHQGAVLNFLQAAHPTGVMTVELLIQLLTGQNSLLSVDDNDEIAAVSVGGELGLVLAAQQLSSLGSGLAQRLVSSIQDVPLTLDVSLVSHKSGHR